MLLLGTAYTFGSKELAAPQATLMKTIIEGVLAGALPWGLVLTGGGLAIGAMLCSVSGLAFAIGVYLPLSTMASLYVGGSVRALVNRGAERREKADSDPGVLHRASSRVRDWQACWWPDWSPQVSRPSR